MGISRNFLYHWIASLLSQKNYHSSQPEQPIMTGNTITMQ